MKEIKIELGNIYITPGVMNSVEHDESKKALNRHKSGDWGDLCKEDKETNDAAVIHGDRILSSYETHSGVRFWVVTEADRSSTTILLPEEY